MKLKILIIIIAAVILVGGGIFAGVAIYNNTPENVTKNAVLGVFDDFTEREEIFPIINTLQKGSVQLSMSEFNVKGDTSDYNFEFEGKIYFSKKAVMVDEVFLNIDDIEVGGSAYISADKIYINETELLEQSIGLVKGDLADDFKDSIFAYGSNSNYSITDKAAYESIINILEFYDSLDNDAFAKDAEKIVKKYAKELWKIFCEHAEFESESDNVKLQGEKQSVRVVTVSVDGKAISNIIEDAYDYLKEDEDIIEFIDKYESDLYSVFEKNISYDYDSFAEYYEKYIDEIEKQVKKICKGVKDADTEITLEIVTPKLSSKLLKLNLNVDKKDVFVVDFGKDGVKKSDEISIQYDNNEFVYEIIKKSSDSLEAVIEVNDEEIVNFEWDKKDDEYSLSIGDDYDVEGTISKKLGKTTITVDEISVFGYNNSVEKYSTNLAIIIDEKDSMPKILKDFDRLSDINEDKINNIIGDLKVNIEGTYSRENWIYNTTYRFFENKVTLTITKQYEDFEGYEEESVSYEGTYEINMDTITFKFYDAGAISYNKTVSFEKTENGILLDDLEYIRK